jgi:hypothetical protein
VSNNTIEMPVRIPIDLEDCFVVLQAIIPTDDLRAFKTRTEKDATINHHHGFGRWMRNNWGLWTESTLQKWFIERGVSHADDMSGIILRSFWRFLNNEPIKLDEQIQHYQDYWKKINKVTGG